MSMIDRKHNWYMEELVKAGMSFHWHDWDTPGSKLEERNYIASIKELGVKTVTIEARCASGWSYYPTKYGFVHPNLQGDYFGNRLRILHDNSFRVIAYFDTGFLGYPAYKKFPGWIRYGSGFSEGLVGVGKEVLKKPKLPGPNQIAQVSFHSGYLKKYLFPHLEELVNIYPIDALWLDIFEIATRPDYNPGAQRWFKKITGRSLLPPKDDPDFKDTLLVFQEEGSRIAMEICNSLHHIKPNLMIALNHRYNTAHHNNFLQEDVDYLSCDPESSVPIAFLSARRYYSLGKSLGKPAEIISTIYRNFGVSEVRPTEVVLREAATSIAGGSTFLLYHGNSSPTGKIENRYNHIFKSLDSFIKKRSNIFLQGNPFFEVVLLSTNSSLKMMESLSVVNEDLKGRPQFSIEGSARYLLEKGINYAVVSEENLKEHLELKQTKMLILSDQAEISSRNLKDIQNFVTNGGTVLSFGLIVPELQKMIGVKIEENQKKWWPRGFINDYNNTMWPFPTRSLTPAIVFNNKVNPILSYWQLDGPDQRKPSTPQHIYKDGYPANKLFEATIVGNAGKGKLCICSPNLMAEYRQISGIYLAPLIDLIFKSLSFKSLFKVSPKGKVAVVPWKTQKGYLIHLINLLEYAYPIPFSSLTNVSVTIPGNPEIIKPFPEDAKLVIHQKGGITTVTVPELPIHVCLEIRY